MQPFSQKLKGLCIDIVQTWTGNEQFNWEERGTGKKQKERTNEKMAFDRPDGHGLVDMAWWK